MEFHRARAFARDEPRVELIERLLKSILQVAELEYDGKPVKVDGFRLRDLNQWRTTLGPSQLCATATAPFATRTVTRPACLRNSRDS
jgi:hypothetical protein